MGPVSSIDQAGSALELLRACGRQRDVRRLWPEEQVQGAVAAGASLEQVAAALGMDEAEAWERLTRRLRAEMRKNAAANSDLSETEALELAVAETKAVRRERSERKAASGPRSDLSV